MRGKRNLDILTWNIQLIAEKYKFKYKSTYENDGELYILGYHPDAFEETKAICEDVGLGARNVLLETNAIRINLTNEWWDEKAYKFFKNI